MSQEIKKNLSLKRDKFISLNLFHQILLFLHKKVLFFKKNLYIQID